jgi:hypothetical protein
MAVCQSINTMLIHRNRAGADFISLIVLIFWLM